MFLSAALLTAGLVIADFGVESAFRGRLARGSLALRAAAAAQAFAWTEQSALVGFGNPADTVLPERAASLQAYILAELERVRVLTADDPRAHQRVDALAAAVDRWSSGFLAPISAGAPRSADLMARSRVTFDEVSKEFDTLIALLSDRRVAALESLDRTSFLGSALILLALALGGAVFTRVARQLEAEAEVARVQHALLGEQAAEMEQQSAQLEQQASSLEEQTAELEHRIEERDETNRLLEETAAYLDSAVESAPMGVAFFDRELRLVRVNEAIAAMDGTPAAAHVGRRVADVAPAIALAVTPVLTRVLRTGAAEFDETVDVPSQDATTVRRFRYTCYPLRAKGRAPVGVGVMVLDVTERVQLEEQLRQSQKMEAVGRLAGGIAHDFNNVLTIIQSYAELLTLELGDGAKGHEEVRAIRAAADRAAALARQLLSFSRREVVIPRVIDLNEVVGGMHQILARLLKQGIDLQMEVADAPLLVRADAGQLEQVVMNLVINAVHAMPQGGTIRVGTKPLQDAGLTSATDHGGGAIIVSDSGTGMSVGVQSRLFEPFFTTKPAGEGTGLGLATAYAIVRAADGVIRVKSEEGAGSRFTVILPLRSASEREPDPRHSPLAGIPVARADETILLVEDEPAIRQALLRVLTANGYRVIEASNGGEALRRAEEEPGVIDLMLTDVMMPGIGGKELVQRLRVTRPQTRVILMSGYTDDDLLRQDLGSARYVFLQKPFAARQAVAAVRELLDAD